MRLALHPRWVMNRADFDRCRSGYYLEEGGVVAIFQQGEGFLVVLADDTIFDNERIAGVDHALFLWHLVKYFERSAGGGGAARRPHRPRRLPLADGLAAAGGASPLLTLFFVWEQAPRFGPLMERKKSGQRGLRAHLQAAAAFLWRHHEQPALLEPLRAEVQRRARVAIPGWPAFSPEKRPRRAGAHRPAARAGDRRRAAAREPATIPGNFVALVATLETLRKAL